MDTAEQLHFHFSLSCIGEGNGNPLQCSCLENPRDRGAWGAAVYGVAQSRTRLKRLSSSSRIPQTPLALFIVKLCKACLTSHSRMSGSRCLITSLWLFGSLRSFLYRFSIYSCHFLLSSFTHFSCLFSLYTFPYFSLLLHLLNSTEVKRVGIWYQIRK